jgi:uncharacterized protein (DUF433 family)
MADIVRTEDVMGGEPRLAGHRISVLQVAEMVLQGDHSPEYVADQLDLSLAEVHAALSYYYEHPEEMDEIRDSHADLESKLQRVAHDPDHIEQ